MEESVFKLIEEKYNYLSLLEIIYDKHNRQCYVVFLYPSSQDDIDDNVKNDILSTLSELKLNAEIILKFKKSYLEPSFIQKDVKTYLDDNHISVGCQVSLEDIKVDIKQDEILIDLKIVNSVEKYVKESQIVKKIENDISKKYFTNSKVNYEIKEVDDFQHLVKENFFNAIYDKVEVFTPRYKVASPVKFIGDEISPCPECIKNIDKEKQLVILAGVVKELQKKEWTKKTIKGDEIRHLYSFTLQDFTGEIQTTYFSSRTNEKKMDTIVEGSSLLLMGNVRVGFRNKLVYYPKHISFCTQKPEYQFIEERKVEKQVTTYQYVEPEPFFQHKQDNIFDVQPNFSEYVMNNDFVVFDVETTGLDNSTCEIIEIGAVKVKQGKVCEKFSVLIKPHTNIPDYITNINGITDEMVEDCRYGEDIIADFHLFCRDCILAGYNVNFDYGFIQSLAKKVGLSFNNELFDVLEQARKSLHLKSYKLINVVKELGLELTNAHRAYWDAFATAEVFLKLSEIK